VAGRHENGFVPKRFGLAAWVSVIAFGAVSETEIRRRRIPVFKTVMATLLLVVGGALVAVWSFPDLIRGEGASSLVVYCSQDQVYAEPILERFRGATGIGVSAVYDSEAVKTVGLANRLVAEQAQPRCDVWWGNEPLRPRQLVAMGAITDASRVRTFGSRHRVLVVPEAASRHPRSIRDLTNAAWRGRVSIANPLFGSTSTHLHALRSVLGEGGWRTWCEALAANRPFIEDGNSQVVRRVARGEAWVGLTDSDDVFAARRESLPVRALPCDSWTLEMPNVVVLVKPASAGSPAAKLAEHLMSVEVRLELVRQGALDPDPEDPSHPNPGLKPDWPRVVRDLDAVTKEIQGIFRG
jgi:iron(III) transport system substrate-binding protein